MNRLYDLDGVLARSLLWRNVTEAIKPLLASSRPPRDKTQTSNNMKHTKLSTIIASAVGLLSAPFATAIPVLYYDIGNNGTIDGSVTDQGGGDFSAVVGSLIGSFSSGSFLISSTAATKPAIGTGTSPELANTTLELSGIGTIAIYFTEDGYGPTSQGYLAQLSVTSLANSATVDYYTYASQAAFDITNLGVPMTSQSLGGLGANVDLGTLPFDGSVGTYTLTQRVVISQPNGGSTQLTANLKNVPEGGTTLALLGASLVGVGTIRRKLMKR